MLLSSIPPDQLIDDIKRVMIGVNKSWSKVLPDANSVLVATFVLYNSINQLVQNSDPTNDKLVIVPVLL